MGMFLFDIIDLQRPSNHVRAQGVIAFPCARRGRLLHLLYITTTETADAHASP